jgi:hypothetical protein
MFSMFSQTNSCSIANTLSNITYVKLIFPVVAVTTPNYLERSCVQEDVELYQSHQFDTIFVYLLFGRDIGDKCVFFSFSTNVYF